MAETPDLPEHSVAIVGVAGRLPAARTVGEFWAALVAGEKAVAAFSPEELAAAGVPESALADPDYVTRGTVMPDVDRFDAGFFGITPAEARITDPQHRVFLECVQLALDDAGVRPEDVDRQVGVYGATALSSYLFNNVLASDEYRGKGMPYPVLIGNDKDFLATRVAYRLDLHGPALTVQTACSSSLVAVHLACQSLTERECDVAVAGGVSITVPQAEGYAYQEGGTLSRDGECRPFDADASGTTKGNGCAVVVLKRLADAIADRDTVYAVIRGTAVNNDGSGKAGYTAPGKAGQAAAIRDALAFAGVPAADVGYVETHGTGTYLGDPIEVAALADALGPVPDPVHLGSVKANVGHLDAAAGVTALVKAALVLRHGVLPGQVNFTRPNPELGLERTPFVVSPRPVDARGMKAVGVSSFGIGGTNAHAVLAPAPVLPRPDAPAGDYVVALSAQDPEALARMAADLLPVLDTGPRIDDLAFTLLVGRRRRAHTLSFVAGGVDAVRFGLQAFLAGWSPPPAPELPPAADLVPDRLPAALGDLRHARRIPLPGYPLRRDRHWIDAPARVETARPATAAVAADGAPVNVDAEMLAIVRSALNLPAMGVHEDFFAVGGESLVAVEIVAAVKERFGVTMSLAQFEDLRTPGRMAAYVRQSGGRRLAEPVLTRVRDGEPGRELFYVHPAGGTTFCYYELARHSTEPSPVWALSFPFSEAGTLRSIPEVAARYVEEIRAVKPQGPYRLGGYSFGGNVAFEMALQLQAAGARVEEIVMFDSHPPEAYAGQLVTEEEFLRSFPLLLQVAFGDSSALGMAPPRSVREVVEMARQPSWTSYTEDEYEKFVRAWIVNHEALKLYEPWATFDGDVTVFAARQPEDPRLLEMLKIRSLPKDTWQRHVDGRVTVVPAPGNHYTMFSDEECLVELAATYDRVLAGPVAAVPA